MQMTIENTYDNLKSSLDDLELMLHQMVRIDRARDVHELHDSIQNLLQAMGDYTKADRVFIFEFRDALHIYRNTYEWCAPGITPQIDNLQTIEPSDIPVWQAAFEQGENIVIPNLEDVRDTMPGEYEILRVQDIHSEISFPIFSKDALIGFLGLDNPTIEGSYRFINLLAVVGSHLGGAWANFRTSALLEQSQSDLRDSMQALQKDQQVLEALCRDYTCVYTLDPVTDRIELVQVDPNANAQLVLAALQTRQLSHHEIIHAYYQNFVVKASARDFLTRLDGRALLEELNRKERVIYRFRALPNSAGQEYFELQAVKINTKNNPYRILVGFHHIDDIVNEELRQQKELETALAEARLNSEIVSAISKIYFSIYRIDLNADIYDEISSGEEFHRLTGLSGKASLKMKELCNTFVTHEYYDRVMLFLDLSTLKERLSRDESVGIEYLAKDGNWHLARFIVKKRDENGQVSHVLYTTRLISDTKHREQNWIVIAEAANKANKAKTDFLSRMAHDIRTPMNAIMGFTSIAQNQLDNTERLKDTLRKIQISGRYLQQIADDVLDISRIESGSLKLDNVDTSITRLFQDTADTAREIQPEKHLQFFCDAHDIAYEHVLGDPLHLQQIYMNLLSNAVKYTPEGGEIHFEIYQELLPHNHQLNLISIIRDTGIGMSPEFMKEMYSKFSRAVDTRVNKVRGSGLGLTIVRELMELMQGTIHVQSTPGEGTCFKLTIPLTYLDPDAEPDKIGQKKAPAEELCKGMHLLVAEDNDLNYEVASELLALRDVTCDRAEDGAICVERFNTAQPFTYNAILMDIQMPVMDGLEATMAIRTLEHPQAKSIPIIAMTANAFTDDVNSCMAAGMNRHMSKPLNIDDLLEVLASYRN